MAKIALFHEDAAILRIMQVTFIRREKLDDKTGASSSIAVVARRGEAETLRFIHAPLLYKALKMQHDDFRSFHDSAALSAYPCRISLRFSTALLLLSRAHAAALYRRVYLI